MTGQILDDAHGAGRVKVPPESTFNRLVNALVDTRELPGRPAGGAAVPTGPFTPTGHCGRARWYRSTPPGWM
ncbi:hypothetical protein [Streptomyces sp. TLI_146]|uniref:hypothetical protein n=1 Tax=Streptomyces sp. TLI_146 TaxID=1938858 RepID=UPI00214CBA37|nr:hypothetical protein [Streptomyces sp. TLI_146]